MFTTKLTKDLKLDSTTSIMTRQTAAFLKLLMVTIQYTFILAYIFFVYVNSSAIKVATAPTIHTFRTLSNVSDAAFFKNSERFKGTLMQI